MKIQVSKKDLQFKHPCNILVAGQSGSGKTILIRNILKNFKDLFFGLENIDSFKVLWIHGVKQNLYKVPIPNNVKVKYETGLPDIDEVSEINPRLIVIDDLIEDLTSSKAMADFFTKFGHHKKRTIIFTVRNLLHQGSKMRTISLNSHYIIAMKNPRDVSQEMFLARQIDVRNPSRIIEVYRDAVRMSYGYLCFDFRVDTDRRLRTRITREENKKKEFPPIIYLPKKLF